MKTQDGIYQKVVLRFDQFNLFLNWLCKLLYALIVLAVVMDVILRYVFNSPTVWVFYASGYAMLYATFLCGAYVLGQEGHVRVDLLVNMFSKRSKVKLDVLGNFVGLIYFAVLFWYSGLVTYDAFKGMTTFPIPIKVYQFSIIGVIPLGSGVLCLQFVRRLIDCFFVLSEKSETAGAV